MPQIPPSPRRSSRATRPGQQNSSAPTSHSRSTPVSNLSSASSTSSLSGRERSTRSARQSSPPTKASTPTSEESIALMATRRSRRQLETSQPSDSTKGSSRGRDNDDDDIAEDEETTRCVCEFQEYPGPPLLDPTSTRNAHKSTTSSVNDDNDGNEDEPGSLFIQCDSCEVWQHGGCVGIMSDDATPDNYFCELCRPEFHHLSRTASGQKYSRYVPIDTKRNSRKLSGIRGDDTRTATRDTTKAGSAEAPKRRSTMNSRATLDEDEQLRKALEISKQDGGLGTPEAGLIRKSKRGRDDSEDNKSDIKRQRTHSSEPSHVDSPADSNTDRADGRDDRRKKTPRSTALEQSQKDTRELDRRSDRHDPASKHKSRRRADEADETGDEKLQVDEAVAQDENDNNITGLEDHNATTSANVTPQPPNRSNVPNSRKRGRGGKTTGIPSREGYTDAGSPAKNGKDTDSPRDNARDGVASEADSANGTNGIKHPLVTNHDRPANGARRGRPGRDRHEGPRELTLTELKRRAAAMLEFISRSQKEMADAEMRDVRSPKLSVQCPTSSNGTLKPPGSSLSPPSAGKSDKPLTNGNVEHAAGGAATLADDLATRLVKWQQEFTGEAAAAASSDS